MGAPYASQGAAGGVGGISGRGPRTVSRVRSPGAPRVGLSSWHPGRMYTLLSGLYKYVFQKDEYCILILGLDNAGKTVCYPLS